MFDSPGHDLVPLLFVEVDDGTEAPIVAPKIERYARFFARRATLSGGEVPLWWTVWPTMPRRWLGKLWPARGHPHYDERARGRTGPGGRGPGVAATGRGGP
ncbi:hypothetical protein DN051_39850 [Streptomyces cadmiisoli]|uniref:Uncharacterized protein n=1 Tax=Streptomyces cadmiisoli TaxID=2184053 RepID=A0A2Z4JAB1_9ACTN|nr:hypothetical protein DN051_39850 [Streptomyces cadmiisoli]